MNRMLTDEEYARLKRKFSVNDLTDAPVGIGEQTDDVGRGLGAVVSAQGARLPPTAPMPEPMGPREPEPGVETALMRAPQGPGMEPSELAQFKRTAHMPAAEPAPMPATMPDDEMEAARAADRRQRIGQGLLGAAGAFRRGLVGGDTLDFEKPGAVSDLEGSRKAKLAAAVAALKAKREGIDAEVDNDLKHSQAERNRRVEPPRDNLLAYEEFKRKQEADKRAADARDFANETARKNAERPRATKGGAAPKETTLSTSALNDLADVDVAIGALEGLSSEFDRLDMGSDTARMSNAVLPLTRSLGISTDAGEFDARLRMTMQGVGKILEGGKLAQSDEAKYQSMILKPGDSAAAKKAKTAGMVDFLKDIKSGRIKIYREAGYKVPGGADSAKPADGVKIGKDGNPYRKNAAGKWERVQ